MKFKTTEKAVKNNYIKIIKIPYCGLQTLLSAETPIAYTSSADYGWKSDIYEIPTIEGKIAISTGYVPFGNVVLSYDLREKYENKSLKELSKKVAMPFAKRKAQNRKQIIAFINEACREREG